VVKVVGKVTKPKAPKRQRGSRAAGQAGQKGLRVKQVKSGIGHADTYRRTLRALGLRHHQQEIIISDTPSARGMLHKVRHLVRVTEEA
jgi:large subunit ribosomal protein L30